MKITTILLVLLLGAPVFAVPVSVSVVDAKGAPVAGADVQLSSFDSSAQDFVVHQTGADGRATFDVDAPKPSLYGNLIGRIEVLKSGFAVGVSTLDFKTPGQIKLVQAGPPIGGVVLDANKKPVAGARVGLTYWSKGGAFPMFLSDGPLQARIEATTDEKGEWTIGALPPDVTAFTSILAPGFARQRTEVASGAHAQTTLHAGGRVQGRLLGLDEKPLAGLRVYAQPINGSPSQEGFGEARTTQDGSFVLDGLEAGTYNVMFHTGKDSPFVVAAHEGVKASVDAPVQLPESRAVVGVLLGGKVTERGTGQSIEGVEIAVYGAINPMSSAAVSSATTDKNGAWKMRTLPGQSKVYVMGAPQEFVREESQQTLEVGAKGKSDLNFELARASKISGRLVDENGQGVKTSSLVLRQNHDEHPFQSDENGDFTAFGPKDGEVEVTRSRWNREETESSVKWDVVGTKKFSIPSNKPLEIKLKRAQVSSLELGVFDQNDAAIEGAKVVVMLSTWNGRTGQSEPHELVSDKTGRVHLDGIRADEKVTLQSATKKGFDAAPLPTIAQLNGVYRADITLVWRSGKAQGDVFDSRGEVAARASVFGSGVDVTTDGAGRFSLAPLPSGKTEIVAWKDDGFALGLSDQTRFDLKPQTLEATNIERAKELLDALKQETKGTKYWNRDSLGLGLTGSDFDASVAGAKTTDIRGIYPLVMRFGSDASVPTAKWIALFGNIKSPSERLYAAGIWNSQAPTLADDDTTRGFLDSLENDVATTEKDTGDKWTNAIGIFGAAAFAERLGQHERADALFGRGQAYVLKNFPEKGGTDGNNPSQDDTFGVMGELVAVSPRLLSQLVALVDNDSPAYSRLLKDGAPVVARLSGLEAAKPFLERLKSAPKPRPDAQGRTSSTEWLLLEAVTDSIVAGGKSNPRLALELAQSLPKNSEMSGDYGQNRALCEAAFFQSPAVAATLWRECLPNLEASAAMRFVARIAQRDEPLARGFYETVRQGFDALPEQGQNPPMYERAREVAAFAFYEARFAPARSRARLERGFFSTRDDQNARYDLAKYARAMALFDTSRALQWADQIGNEDNSFAGFEAKRRIARWLALDAARRQKASFGDRFGRDEGDF